MANAMAGEGFKDEGLVSSEGFGDAREYNTETREAVNIMNEEEEMPVS